MRKLRIIRKLEYKKEIETAMKQSEEKIDKKTLNHCAKIATTLDDLYELYRTAPKNDYMKEFININIKKVADDLTEKEPQVNDRGYIG